MLVCVLLSRSEPELARKLFAISPLLERVEQAEGAGQAVFLDVTGTSRLHGGTVGLFAAIRSALGPGQSADLQGMALASNRFTAEVAARCSGRAVAIAPGEEALYLAQRPLSELPLSASLARRLGPLGLETLGEFAALPVAAVDRRYGPEGIALHRLARGEDDRSLLPEQPGARRSVWRQLEHPVDRLLRLEPFLEQALTILCEALEERGEGLLSLRLQLFFSSGQAQWELSPATPERRVPLLLELTRLRLQAQPPQAAVSAFQLEVLRTQRMAVHQAQLFGGLPGDTARDPARRAEALARLTERLGQGALGQPQMRAAHRLEDRWQGGPGEVPARPAAGPALRVLAEPERLVPVSMGGQLMGFRRGAQELSLGRLSAPRRLEGGWWATPWARDEHDLEPLQGGRLRICRDLGLKCWLLLGEFD